MRQVQLHGNITKSIEGEGIVLKLHDSNEEYTLPPDISAIHAAPHL